MNEETHMGGLTALLIGIAASAVISTVAEAEDDGCGPGWYYDGRGCVPAPLPPDYYRPPAPDYYQPPPPPPAGYFQPPPYQREYYALPQERGPQLWSDQDDDARYSPPHPAFKTWNNCPPNFTVQDGLCKPYTGR
jgi:hypothetical protein